MELFFFFNKLNIIKNITMYILSLIYNITSKPPPPELALFILFLIIFSNKFASSELLIFHLINITLK